MCDGSGRCERSFEKEVAGTSGCVDTIGRFCPKIHIIIKMMQNIYKKNIKYDSLVFINELVYAIMAVIQ